MPLLTNPANYLKASDSGSSTFLSIATGGSGSGVPLTVLQGLANLGHLLSHTSLIL